MPNQGLLAVPTPGRRSRPRASRAAVAASSAQEGRRTFLRLASHELRTPLNAIIGFSEIIASELYGPLSEPRYREHARLVHQSGLKLLGLVNDILEMARLQSGAADLELQPVRLDQALADAAAAAMREFAGRGVSFDWAEAPELTVRADPQALGAVLTHLLHHGALRLPGGGTLSLRLRCLHDRAIVEIADDGERLPFDHLARLLQPFAQGDDALTGAANPGGLRLPLARLLAEAMQGRLRLRPGVDAGLVAVLSLPLA